MFLNSDFGMNYQNLLVFAVKYQFFSEIILTIQRSWVQIYLIWLCECQDESCAY